MKLKLANVSKRFESHVALDGFSLDLPYVRSLVLIGPSGGGKTSLLRVLGGLLTPDSGEVELDGQRLPVGERALLSYRRTVGVVFQALNLFPHLTAIENITLPLVKVHGLSPAEAQATASQLLRRFQLETHGNKKPAALSGGQRQRIAIARAVAIKPRVLLLDEPTSALDPEMTAEVLDMIGQLRQEGSDLVLATHQLGFARVVAERVAFIAGGRLAECGTPQQLFDSPQTEVCRRFVARVLKY